MANFLKNAVCNRLINKFPLQWARENVVLIALRYL